MRKCATTLSEKKALNRQHILDIAEKMLVTRPDVSLELIAKEAGVGPATFYRYFGDKTNLVHALVDRLLQFMDTVLVIEHPEVDSLEQVIDQWIHATLAHPQRLMLLMSDGFWLEYSNVLKGTMKKMIESKKKKDALLDIIIEQEKKRGVINPDLPTSWIRDHILHTSLAIIEHMHQSNEKDITRALHMLKTTIFFGIAAR